MKLKIILLITLFSGTTYAAWCQTSDDEAEAIINLLGVQKKEAVAKLVPDTGKDSIAFWKIYDQYQQ